MSEKRERAPDRRLRISPGARTLAILGVLGLAFGAMLLVWWGLGEPLDTAMLVRSAAVATFSIAGGMLIVPRLEKWSPGKKRRKERRSMRRTKDGQERP